MGELIPDEGKNDETSWMLGKTYSNLMEGLTGVAASDRPEWALSIGRLFQSVRGGYFLKVLHQEWDQYRQRGKIQDDYINSEQHRVNLGEMLDFLENGKPEEVTFNFLKKIFLVAATEKNGDRNSLLPQQFIKIARTLNSGEILVMSAAFNIAKSGYKKLEHPSVNFWLQDVAIKSGLEVEALVEFHETTLIDKGLITKRRFSDRSGIVLGKHFRLTDLAYRLCKYIEEYEEEI